MKISFHKYILIILISVWPNLFKRYYNEYKRTARKYKQQLNKKDSLGYKITKSSVIYRD
jgi:hypothetical protein